MSKIARGTITSPTSSIILPLPKGFLSFTLRYDEFRIESSLPDFIWDEVVFCISVDGGLTYLADAANNDTYFQNGVSVENGVVIKENSDFLWSVLPTGHSVTPDSIFGCSGQVIIYPGSDTSLFHCFTQSGVVLNGVHAFDNKYGGLNPAATVPPTKARATHIKLKPYDDGTANDADEFFTSGSYVFEGTRL